MSPPFNCEYHTVADIVSFSYLELYLSVAQSIRNFRLELSKPIHRFEERYDWMPVPLPERKEWVAAVPVGRLEVVMNERI